MMDSDSAYKPNGDYLAQSPYGWHHTAQDLQFAASTPVYAYGDYGPVMVKSEYDDCGGGGGSGGGGGGSGGDGCGDGVVGSAGDTGDGGSSSSPGLEQDSAQEPKKGTCVSSIPEIRCARVRFVAEPFWTASKDVSRAFCILSDVRPRPTDAQYNCYSISVHIV